MTVETVPRRRKAQIQGWMHPSVADEVWYPIEFLSPALHARIKVRLCGGDWSGLGKIDRHPVNRRWMWYEWRDGLGEYAPLTPWRRLKPDDKPGVYDPVGWAPLDASAWAGVLPPAKIGNPYRAIPPPPPIEIPTPEGDGWPYPGLRLGQRVPPLSERETEARILRACRTGESQRHVGHAAGSIAADWPSEWYYIGARIEARMQAEELKRQGRIETHVGTVRALWCPTRRDQGDWDYALAWLQGISSEEREVVSMRAANPPHSFVQIGRALSVDPMTAGRKYKAAIAAAHAYATGGAS